MIQTGRPLQSQVHAADAGTTPRQGQPGKAHAHHKDSPRNQNQESFEIHIIHIRL